MNYRLLISVFGIILTRILFVRSQMACPSPSVAWYINCGAIFLSRTNEIINLKLVLTENFLNNFYDVSASLKFALQMQFVHGVYSFVCHHSRNILAANDV